MEIDQNYPVNDRKARVAELVDAADSKSAAARREGSSPFSRTINNVLAGKRFNMTSWRVPSIFSV